MKNIKLIGIIAVIAFLIIAVVTANVFHQKYLTEKESRIRLEDNQRQLAKADSLKYVHLTVTLNEFKDIMSSRVDSIIKASKIKAKNVTSVTERYFYYRDTSYGEIRPDPVITPSGKIYPVDYKKDCFSFKGFMIVDTLLRPSLIITERKFINNSTDVGYIYRPRHFLFIKFGKWKGDLNSLSDCGETTIKQIDIIKK